MKKISLSIQNALTSSFLIVEELINEIENAFNNKDRIFSKIKKNIEKKEEIEEKIRRIKMVLKKIKEDLNLREEIILDKAIIGSRCAKIWEILNDIKGEKLRKYGDVPKSFENYLDPLIEKILKLVNEIMDL
ncbi:MAG: hypothetical protein NC827_01715 [Candidatus Omnitrophica bacterium]|nr:hypothetical protein [Candidatus Omnitrophota bacterium]MCM8802012.1 hypothetical protein [Candidatus Omnitrophota bacterium]